jgi:mRNA-degrading endonuclease YafQ of YafQ-DinJ toxin-antitoxin module
MPRIEEGHWKSIQALPHKAQRENALKFIKEYLPYTPKTLMPNGKLKELRGEHKGIWQFDIDRDYRILYTI